MNGRAQQRYLSTLLNEVKTIFRDISRGSSGVDRSLCIKKVVVEVVVYSSNIAKCFFRLQF